MPKSWCKAVPRHQKKERWTNNDKTNVAYESTVAQRRKNCIKIETFFILDSNQNMEMVGHLVCVIAFPVPASAAQFDAPSDWRPGGRGFNPRRGRQHSFLEIDHEIFPTVILSLPLIQEGQLSVSGEKMCTILVNRLED